MDKLGLASLEVDRIVREMGLVLEDVTRGTNSHSATLKKVGDDTVLCRTNYGSTESFVRVGPHTRANEKVDLEELPVGNIMWIECIPESRGMGLASIMIMHDICEMHKLDPTIEYFTLDDDSDRASSSVDPNIYGAFGFEHRDLVERDISSVRDKRGKQLGTDILPSGPEKQMKLADFVSQDLSRVLSTLERKKNEYLGRKTGGTRRKIYRRLKGRGRGRGKSSRKIKRSRRYKK